MKKRYTGKYEARPRIRPLLLLAIGSAVLALLASVYVGAFFLKGMKRKEAGKELAQTYVIPASTKSTPTTKKPDKTKPANATDPAAAETTEPTEPPRFPRVDFQGLREKNPNVVAWLQIPALEMIDYPVVIGEDNAFYVSHDWENNESEAGAIFLDFRNQPDFSQVHNILYGHCMKDGTMFQTLGKWEGPQYFSNTDKTVLLYLPDEVRVYEIVAVERVNALDQRVYKTDYTPGEDWQAAIKDALFYSQHSARPEYNGQSEMLTFSTCVGGNTRLAVHALCMEHVPN